MFQHRNYNLDISNLVDMSFDDGLGLVVCETCLGYGKSGLEKKG
jgi:hypothetical protein